MDLVMAGPRARTCRCCFRRKERIRRIMAEVGMAVVVWDRQRGK